MWSCPCCHVKCETIFSTLHLNLNSMFWFRTILLKLINNSRREHKRNFRKAVLIGIDFGDFKPPFNLISLRSCIELSNECFIRYQYTLKWVKKYLAVPRFSTHFAVFGYSAETLFLLFDILLLDSKNVQPTHNGEILLKRQSFILPGYNTRLLLYRHGKSGCNKVRTSHRLLQDGLAEPVALDVS